MEENTPAAPSTENIESVPPQQSAEIASTEETHENQHNMENSIQVEEPAETTTIPSQDDQKTLSEEQSNENVIANAVPEISQEEINQQKDIENATERFMELWREYESILNETNPQYIENKVQITAVYQGRLSEIDNFQAMREALITQEAKFRQQIVDDAATWNSLNQ